MLTIQEIKEKLKDRNLMVVAYNSGVSYGTVVKIAKGCESCRYFTVKKVSDYLEKNK